MLHKVKRLESIFFISQNFHFPTKAYFFRGEKSGKLCLENCRTANARQEEDKKLTNGNSGGFAARLRETMDEKKISGRELAARAGTTEATVSRYASGERNPENFAVLAGLAKGLDVSSDYLLGLTNNPFLKGSLPEEVKELLARYLRASETDKRILWTVLEKYDL